MPRPVPMSTSFHAASQRYVRLESSMNDLAKEFCVSSDTIKKWILSLEIPLHSISAAISAKKIGKPSPRKGATHSDAAKYLMSEAAKRRTKTTKGYKFSEESKEKMRVAALRRIATTDSVQKMQAGRTKNKLPDAELIARKKARDACKRMLRRILTMARVKKDGRRSEHLLGYTKQDLRAHLERQFRDGMGWEVRGSFHIDHIKPVAQFFREGIYDPAVINALSNLQVLTPAENMAKTDKFDFSGEDRTALIIDSTGTRAFA